jgi:hypothetical protein
MTWRVCSPPWPGRENPGSWPRRRQCGLPSAGPPLRSASHPLPGDLCGTDGPGGLGHHPVPEPSWPRPWSSQWPGWAASSRPTRTCCPAPFSRWPTSRWRPRPRIAPARYRPPRHRERDTLMPRSSRPAAQAPDLATRPVPLSAPARRRRQGRGSRHSRYHPVTAPAAPLHSTRRFRRRRHRTIPIRRSPGPRSSPARASSPGPQASPPPVRTLPDLSSDRDDRGVDRRDLVGADGTAPGHADIAVG